MLNTNRVSLRLNLVTHLGFPQYSPLELPRCHCWQQVEQALECACILHEWQWLNFSWPTHQGTSDRSISLEKFQLPPPFPPGPQSAWQCVPDSSKPGHPTHIRVCLVRNFLTAAICVPASNRRSSLCIFRTKPELLWVYISLAVVFRLIKHCSILYSDTLPGV